MEIRNTAGVKDLRDAARLNVFNMQNQFERGEFSPLQVAYYMYALSECAAEICERIMNTYPVQAVVQEMIHTAYGSADVPASVAPDGAHHNKPKRTRKPRKPADGTT